MGSVNEETVTDLLQVIENEYRDLVEDSSNTENLRENDFITKIDEKLLDHIENFFRDREGKFQIITEEKREFADNPANPDYTVIVDEMDGTHHLIEQEGPFGTVVGIAKGKEPYFKDVIASGFIDLGNNRKYIATKNDGAYRVIEGRKEKMSTSGKTVFGEGLETKVLLQQGFLAERPDIAEEAWKRWCNDYGSQGKHFALIASGRRDVYITGGHSKIAAKPANTPEEAAGMYLMVKEAGGAVVDWNGEYIAETEIGMKDGKNHDIVAAATKELAEEVVTQAIER